MACKVLCDWAPFARCPIFSTIVPVTPALLASIAFQHIPGCPCSIDFAVWMLFPQIFTCPLPSSPVYFISLCKYHHCRKFFPAPVTPSSPYLALSFFILLIIRLIIALLSCTCCLPCLNSCFMRARLHLCCWHLCLHWQEQTLVNSRRSINICYMNVCH